MFAPVLIITLLLYLQTNYGDIEFGFFPHVAPKTVEHIFKLVRLGCYNTNHIFRVFGALNCLLLYFTQCNLIYFFHKLLI